jgi:hypothetical protein
VVDRVALVGAGEDGREAAARSRAHDGERSEPLLMSSRDL